MIGIRSSRAGGLLVAMALLSSMPSRAVGQQTPAGLLERAIEASGGAASLTALRAIEWEGSAVIHVPGRVVRIRGRWRVLPPDTAAVSTYLEGEDSSTARTLTVAGDRGWMERDTVLQPMPADLLAEESHQFYLYSLLRLLPLRDSSVTLTLLHSDSAGQRGLLVQRVDRLDVAMYFAASGRVSRLRTRFAALRGHPMDEQEIALSGEVLINGVRWFRDMRIRRNGRPYFELHIDSGRPAVTAAASWIPSGGEAMPR